jgi:hypothetical protein
MYGINRREFFRDSAGLAAALAAAGVFERPLVADAAQAQNGTAADRLNVAVVGVRGQGRAHVGGYAGKHNCVVTTICDVDEAVIGPAMKIAEKQQPGMTPKYEKDIRKVLDDKSIHIVSIATPNHWHALAAIWAMQAGKDVYVEKPVSHNVSEGRRIVEFARKLGRVCQTGTQSRSMTGMRESIAYLHSGKLGKVQIARGLCYKPRGSIGKVDGEQPIPKTVDYDLWCGPAPKKPLMRKNLHYDWHWVWDTGNGDLGNQGIHEMDKARWGLQKNELPRVAFSVGGRFGYVDDGETANTQICFFDYGDSQLIFEVRGLKTDPLRDCKVGNIFHCENGVLVCPTYASGIAFDKDGKVLAKFSGGSYDAHFGNFVQAVRSRKPEMLNADILEGHLSSALCHLGNVSYQLGTLQPFNKKVETFGDNEDLAETLHRMAEHLKDNKVPLDQTKYRLGRKLTIDPKTETFVGDKEADKLLTREYRKGFEVPAKA